MQSHWVHGTPYYRCRFAAEYALASHVEHPLSINLREDAVIGQVDRWLAREFAPHRLTDTIHDLMAARQPEIAEQADDHEETARKVAECDRKLARYRAALDAGADPASVARWITETEAEKASYGLARPEPARPATRRRMSEAEIRSIVETLANMARVLTKANPEDKAEIFRQLNLKLTYHPGRMLVKAEVRPTQFGFFDGVRGPRPTNCAR
jgi:site-specific DNA recombinase